MAKSNCKLPLKYSSTANHSLSWSIVDEIQYGNHNLEEFSDFLNNGRDPYELRRYAEILYHKEVPPEQFLRVISQALNKSRKDKNFERLDDLKAAFLDWRAIGALQLNL